MLQITALKVFMVLNSDGTVNYPASQDKLVEQLTEYELRQGEGTGKAASAVGSVFDQYKGARVSMSFVVAQALGMLGATPDNYQMLTEACERYIKVNSGKKEDGALFGLAKGKGCWRYSDEVIEEPKAKK